MEEEVHYGQNNNPCMLLSMFTATQATSRRHINFRRPVYNVNRCCARLLIWLVIVAVLTQYTLATDNATTTAASADNDTEVTTVAGASTESPATGSPSAAVSDNLFFLFHLHWKSNIIWPMTLKQNERPLYFTHLFLNKFAEMNKLHNSKLVNGLQTLI